MGDFGPASQPWYRPCKGSQAAPRLPWSLESSPEPSEAWYQGWLGKLYHYKDGSFNMLLVVAPPLRLLDLLRNEGAGQAGSIAASRMPISERLWAYSALGTASRGT